MPDDNTWSGYIPTHVLKHHGDNPAMQRYIEDFKSLEKHVGGLSGICSLFSAISKLESERAMWKKEVDDQKAYVTGLENRLSSLINPKGL